MSLRLACLVLASAFQPALAQDAPSSAIPWLSDVVDAPIVSDISSAPVEPVTVSTLAEKIETKPGVLTGDQLGLPADFWEETSGTAAIEMLQTTPHSGPPSARRLFRSLLFARLEERADYGAAYHLARVDRLLKIGAIDEADALLDTTKTMSPDVFGRFFDVNLLTNRPKRACDRLAAQPALAPNRGTEVFCLAVNNNWLAADTALELGLALDEIKPPISELLGFFLEPGLIEEVDPPTARGRPSAFEFFLRESAGLPRSSIPPPPAFLHADLVHFIPVRFRMEAAETLVADGALTPRVLFEIYREEVPAASGGVWDRADAVQKFDAASLSSDQAAAITRLDELFFEAGLGTALAKVYAPRLEADLRPSDLPEEVWPIVAKLLLLGGRGDAAGAWINRDATEKLRTALAIAETKSLAPLTGKQATTPSDLTKPQVLQAALTTLAHEGDIDEFFAALAQLEGLGLEKAARAIAIEKLLDPKGSYG